MPKADRDFALAVQTSAERWRTVRLGMTLIAVIVCGYFAYRSIEAMAGKATTFQSIIDWGLKLGVAELSGWVAFVITGGAYIKKRHQCKRLTANANRVTQLESIIDPNRTGSGLAIDGSPPAEHSNE